MLVAQLCLNLWNPTDCSLPDSSLHGILQARILEWVAIPFSRRSSLPRDWTCVSHIAGRFFTKRMNYSQQTPSSNNTEDSIHGHHQIISTEIRLIIFFGAKDGEALYSQQNKTGSWLWLRSWTPYCQIQTEIEESGKNTRPFRYDLNQIPYDYTVEMRNRFKGLDLINRVPEELWTEVCGIVQEARIKTIT